MKDISGKVKEEGGRIVEDIDEFRTKIKEEGAGLRGLGKMFGFFKKKKG